MESLFPKAKPGMASIYGKISESTLKNPLSNVGQIKNSTIKIIVKGKEIDFDRKDPIFSLSEPTKNK